MKDTNDILSKVFRNRLKDYKLKPGQDVWSKIEKDLPAPARSRKLISWIRTGAAASILLAIGITAYLMQHNKPGDLTSKTDVVVEKNEGMNKSNNNLQHVQADVKQDQLADNLIVEQKASTKTNKPVVTIKERNEQQEQTGNKEKESGISTETGISTIKNKDTKDALPAKEEKSNATNEVITHKETTMPLVADTSPEEWLQSEKEISKHKNNLDFALAVGNSGTNASDLKDMLSNNKNSGLTPVLSFSPSLDSKSGYNLNTLDNVHNTNNKPTNVDFSIPITVGLYVRKHLKNNWAVESGLTYTYLSSKESYAPGNEMPPTRNLQLNYVGIPIKMVYSFINNNRFSMYASGGGMVEKCVYGKAENIFAKETTTHTINITELQWSVSGNIGVNYRLVDHLGLFVEPGVSYYFDDGSNIMTVRKDTPFNLHIQGGVRLTY